MTLERVAFAPRRLVRILTELPARASACSGPVTDTLPGS